MSAEHLAFNHFRIPRGYALSTDCKEWKGRQMENAIERVLSMNAVVKHYGVDIEDIKKNMLASHPLDCEKDQPLPKWATDILKDKSVGYRTRIRIVMMHHFDITGESPSWRFVQPKDMKEAPPRDPPKELVELRSKNKAKAEEYFKRKGENI